MAGQQNPAPASNPMVLAKPQPFDGTHGTTSKVFVGQIGLHAVTYPKQFPTYAIKMVFAVLFMKDYTATWSQPYLEKVFNKDWPTRRNSTSTPTPLVGPTPRS
ncbi:uncharacterized protein VP01_13302g1 [Puccinia sorghi]|uniref:Retrotransposon gag domain-containing protein n=1 Tax=Puccinia sorghi TaxID=27349 RepID=A0A0L6VME9_9BASI|nr:uncharacterized protein VP01_13302g1 [Puccinia sorghi]